MKTPFSRFRAPKSFCRQLSARFLRTSLVWLLITGLADSQSLGPRQLLGDVIFDAKSKTLEIQQRHNSRRRILLDEAGRVRAIIDLTSGVRVDLFREPINSQVMVRVTAPDLPAPYDLALEFDHSGRLIAARDAWGSVRLRKTNNQIERTMGEGFLTRFRPGQTSDFIHVSHVDPTNQRNLADFEIPTIQLKSVDRPSAPLIDGGPSLAIPIGLDASVVIRPPVEGVNRFEIDLASPLIHLSHSDATTRFNYESIDLSNELPELTPRPDFRWQLVGEGIGILNTTTDMTDVTFRMLGWLETKSVPEVPQILDSTRLGLNIGSDLTGFMASDGSLGQRFWQHGLLGQTSEAVMTDYIGDRFGNHIDEILGFTGNQSRYAGFGGILIKPVMGLAFDQARGKPLNWASPDAWEHSLDAIAGVVTLYVAKDPKVAALAVDSAGLVRDLTRPGFEQGGRWLSQTGDRPAGQWIYQAVMAEVSGLEADRFNHMMGPLMDRVRWNHQTFGEFENAFRQGDREKMESMLTSGPIHDALKGSGVSDEQITELSNGLLRSMDGAGEEGMSQPFEDLEMNLGGIALDAKPDWDLPIGNLIGVVFDPVSDRLVLVGDGDTAAAEGLKVQDLAMAFASVFGTLEGNTRTLWGAPAFSLDPQEPTNPDGPWYKSTYHPPFLRGSAMGEICALSDIYMKFLSFGVRPKFMGDYRRFANGASLQGDGCIRRGAAEFRLFTLEKWEPPIIGWKTIPDLSLERAGPHGARNRLWLAVEDKVKARYDGGSCLLDPIVMGVRVKRQERGKDGRLHDVDSVDPVATHFARKILTPNYDRLAKKIVPEFGRLKEMASAVAVAVWARKNCESPESFDLAWVNPHLMNDLPGITGMTRVSASASGSRGRSVVTGGANLKVILDPKPDVRAASLRKAVNDALNRDTVNPQVKVPFEGKEYVGMVLPSGVDGRKRWEDRSSSVVNGTEYRLTNKKVTFSKDESGERSFEWQGDRLVSVRCQYPDGQTIKVERPSGDGSIKAVFTDPSLGESEWRWSPDGKTLESMKNGYPVEILEDIALGNQQANTGRRFRMRHIPSDTTTLVGQDGDGRLQHIERSTVGVDRAPIRSATVYKRNPDGSVASLESEEIGQIHIQRDTLGRPTKLDNGRKSLSLGYGGGNGRVPTSISYPNGPQIAVSHPGGQGTTLRLSDAEISLISEYQDGRLESVRSEGGDEVTVQYQEGKIPELLRGSNGLRVIWDEHGRLLRAHLPEELEIEAEYPPETPAKVFFKFFRPE